MRIAAVISEYNPFHKGHKYQIDMLKKEYDAVISIMSGNFVQRGELALCDKWSRAEMAIKNGVDLVIELPVCFSLSTAEKFAYGGVYIANACGVVDALCFGSESGEIQEFIDAAKILLEEPQEVSDEIQKLLKSGMNYPSARSEAYKKLIPDDLLSMPNNILGIEYTKALISLSSEIKPMTIKRIGAGYNETDYTGKLNSASGIRKAIKEGISISEFMPENALEILDKSLIFSNEKLFKFLKFMIISNNNINLANINDIREGLENRIIEGIKKAESLDELLEIIKTKRYTMSHIKRVLMSILLGITKKMVKNPPQYLRVLGMTEMGKGILREMKEKAGLPIVIKTADFSCDMLNADIRATDIANLTINGEVGIDYKKSPIIYKG